jgi:putative transposase
MPESTAKQSTYLAMLMNSPSPAISDSRGKHTERLFWQSGGGYDRNITAGKTLLKMLDYLHLNPVRRGLVQRAADWKWSSATAFEGGVCPIPLDPIPWDWLADA